MHERIYVRYVYDRVIICPEVWYDNSACRGRGNGKCSQADETYPQGKTGIHTGNTVQNEDAGNGGQRVPLSVRNRTGLAWRGANR